MPDRFDLKPALAMVGAVLLLISLFVDWYSPPASLPGVEEGSGATAWTVFESLDLVLAGIAVAVIYGAYEQMSGRDRMPAGLVLPLAGLAVLIVASQLLNPPPAAGPDSGIATGAWLALAGALGMAIGSLLSIAGISLSVQYDRSQGTATTRQQAPDA